MESSAHVEPREPRDVQHTLTSSSAEISDGNFFGFDVVAGLCSGRREIFELPVLEPTTWSLVSAQDNVNVCSTSRGFLSLTWSLVSDQDNVNVCCTSRGSLGSTWALDSIHALGN